jgi:hypothetical protein
MFKYIVGLSDSSRSEKTEPLSLKPLPEFEKWSLPSEMRVRALSSSETKLEDLKRFYLQYDPEFFFGNSQPLTEWPNEEIRDIIKWKKSKTISRAFACCVDEVLNAFLSMGDEHSVSRRDEIQRTQSGSMPRVVPNWSWERDGKIDRFYDLIKSQDKP